MGKNYSSSERGSVTMSDERKIRVKANEVELKLTLTAKLLSKSFEDAVITPFIKAYNKRALTAVHRNDLLGVRIDDDQVLSDLSVPASIVLLKNETVCAELSFRAAYNPAMELPSNPFQAPPTNFGPTPGLNSGPSAPKERLVDFDDGDRSEIEKLKAERRAARLAREGSAKVDEAADGVADAVVAASISTPEPEEPTALAQLAAAEEQLEALRVETAAIRAMLVDTSGEFAEALLDEASKRAAALSAAVNKLQFGMDEISLGELDEELVAPARARRKAINLGLEEDLLSAARKLPAEILAVRRAI